jgi:hypothetical protein
MPLTLPDLAAAAEHYRDALAGPPPEYWRLIRDARAAFRKALTPNNPDWPCGLYPPDLLDPGVPWPLEECLGEAWGLLQLDQQDECLPDLRESSPEKVEWILAPMAKDRRRRWGGVLDKILALTAGAGLPATPLPDRASTTPVSKNGALVLGALLRQYPTLRTIEEIHEDLEHKLSERTIGPELQKLIHDGLAERPPCGRSGATLTPEGKTLAENLSANSTPAG